VGVTGGVWGAIPVTSPIPPVSPLHTLGVPFDIETAVSARGVDDFRGVISRHIVPPFRAGTREPPILIPPRSLILLPGFRLSLSGVLSLSRMIPVECGEHEITHSLIFRCLIGFRVFCEVSQRTENDIGVPRA
jgi:hypothetical protein